MKSCRALGLAAESTLQHYHSHNHRRALYHLARASRHVSSAALGAAFCAAGTRRLSTATPHVPTHAFPSAPAVADRVRAVMRHMPASVVVVTAPGPAGMTVSSFACIDLDGDVAAVAFNVRRPSSTLDAIVATGGVFNVHILAGNEDGARVARHFTALNDGCLFEGLEDRAGCGVERRGAAPVLNGQGVLYVLACRIPQGMGNGALSVMNHAVVVAGVTDVLAGEVPRAEDGEPLTTLGLTYGYGQYRTAGGVLFREDGRLQGKA